MQGTEQPVHLVSVSPFSLGTYPVTRGQWRQVSTLPKVSASLYPLFRLDMPLEVENQLPIDIVPLDEATEFCARISEHTGRSYRLPTESEWEYACRAGTQTTYHFGNGISLQVANFNDGQRPIGLTTVGSKQAPNRFGLYDMHGNVQEWCQDWFHQTYDRAPSDGSAWSYGGDPMSRITRGGMYPWDAERARSAARTKWDVQETSSGTGLRVALSLSAEQWDPRFTAGGVVNAAAEVSGPVSPGQIVSIYGTRIGPAQASPLMLDSSGLVATAISRCQVLFDGIPAPILYASVNQINAVVPYGVDGQSSTQIVVFNQGQTSQPVSVTVASSTPAIFTSDGSGQGQGAILNDDGTLNSSGNPAKPGSVVALFATGAGQTTPAGVDGKIASSSPPAPIAAVKVLVNDVPAQVRYAAGVPGEVAGLLQVNARVPEGTSPGRQPIVLLVGNARSQSGVLVSVR